MHQTPPETNQIFAQTELNGEQRSYRIPFLANFGFVVWSSRMGVLLFFFLAVCALGWGEGLVFPLNKSISRTQRIISCLSGTCAFALFILTENVSCVSLFPPLYPVCPYCAGNTKMMRTLLPRWKEGRWKPYIRGFDADANELVRVCTLESGLVQAACASEQVGAGSTGVARVASVKFESFLCSSKAS